MSRYNKIISRTNEIEQNKKEPEWFSDFVNNLEKNAVKSRREDYSLFDQINNALSNKSKFSTVEEKVIDLQKRTGLFDFLQRKNANAELFKDVPELKMFIDNYIEDRPGTSIEAVIHDALKLNDIRSKLEQNNDLNENMKKYIAEKINEVKSNQSHQGGDMNLGKVDLTIDNNTISDNNPFSNCEPKGNSK